MVMSMVRRFSWTLLAACVVSVASGIIWSDASAQTRPSWCGSQPKLNAAEGAICASPALWEIDARLGRAYRDTLSSAGPRRTELMQSQQSWLLQVRNACGATAPCLEVVYQDRLTALAGFAGQAAAPVSPRPQSSAGNAPAAPDAGTAPQIQQTADGHSVLSFPVAPPDANDFSDYVATFDFGQTKGLGDKPLTNEDRSLIAITNYPATKTSYVHLFVRQPNGDIIVINSFNAQIAKMLKGKWVEAASSRVAANAISGRVLQLSVFDYEGPGRSSNPEELKLKVSVAGDG